jgi:hypothetical protein
LAKIKTTTRGGDVFENAAIKASRTNNFALFGKKYKEAGNRMVPCLL